MKISRQGHRAVIEDGAAARYGTGVFVPAILGSIFIVIIWPPAAGHMRLDLGAPSSGTGGHRVDRPVRGGPSAGRQRSGPFAATAFSQ